VSGTELHWLSATELAAAIQRREVSSREALDHLVARVDRLDGSVHAVVTRDLDAARTAADVADAATAAGRSFGPLHGVPMTVKDSFMTAGMRTTSGAPELGDFVPDHDAAPVAALRAAGAVIYGKTNLPIYAGDMQSYNELFPTTTNPYDASRTPGGSSGGSAAALAAGFTPLELGSDIGGSIRFPAHMSGVMGHKPTYGIVPAHGQIPGPPGTLSLADLAVAGPMARTVEDLRVGLAVMAGPNRWDAPGWRLELPAPARGGPGGRVEPSRLRLSLWIDDPACPVDAEVRELLEGAGRALADAGATVDADARPAFSLDKVAATFRGLLNAANSGGHSRSSIERFAADDREGPMGELHRDLGMRHRHWLSLNERRQQLRLRWEEFFANGWDALLCPVMPRVAIEHDHSTPIASRRVVSGGAERPYLELLGWSAPAGACLLPATVVPVGLTSAGLPVGVQIIGPYLGDLTTLAVAEVVSELVGPLPHPPGF